MTAPDLCQLASEAFPGITFTPIDFGRGHIRAHSIPVRVCHRPDFDGFSVIVMGAVADYIGTGPTILAAHADAVACRAEYEPPTPPTAPVQGTLDL